MADRSISVKIGANVSGLVSGLKAAAQATKDLDGRMQSWVQRNKADISAVSNTLLGVGATLTATAGIAVKTAMDWETAWAGVLKTVDGTPEQIAALEGELRELARTLPASHTEIAAVAEAAGQLGVQVGSVSRFTETMINLGETTNLSAEEAATSLARFSNIMGTSVDDVGRLGASLVGLGNSYATTEGEILAMSMRLAGAGRQIGLSEGQVMGLSAAMTSVGIEAEAGGSAMSLTMKRIGKAVDEGGATLDQFAAVSGMTATQFQRAWREDAAGALTSFVVGLGEAGASGENVNAILTDLGVTGVRESDALLRLSSAGELMGEAMTQGAAEYADGTALVEEANKRYETSASKVQVAINNIKDASIDFGAELLPVVSRAAEGVSMVAQSFGDLPGPVKTATTLVAGTAGFGALTLGAMGKAVTSISDARQAFEKLGISARTAGSMAGVASVALAGITAAAMIWMDKASQAKRRTDMFAEAFTGVASEVSKSAEEIARNAILTGEGIDWGWYQSWTSQAGSFVELLDVLGYNLDEVAAATTLSKEAFREWQLAQLDALTASGATVGQLDQFMSKTGELNTAFLRQKEVQEAINGVTGETADVLEDAADSADTMTYSTGEAKSAMDSYADSLAEGTHTTQQYSDALEELIGLQREAAGVVLTVREAERKFEASVAAATESVKEHGRNLDITTEAGRKNQSALDDIADSGWTLVESMRANGATQKELEGAVQKTREKFIAAAEAMGMSSDEANALADQLNLIPKNINVAVNVNTSGAQFGIDQFIWKNNGRTMTINVATKGAKVYAGAGGTMLAKAEGGLITGPGTGTSDSIPAWVSNGEFVMKAAAVEKYGVGLMHAINAGKFANGGLVGNPRPMAGMPAITPAVNVTAPTSPGVDEARLADLISVGVGRELDARLGPAVREIAGVASGSTRMSRTGG